MTAVANSENRIFQRTAAWHSYVHTATLNSIMVTPHDNRLCSYIGQWILEASRCRLTVLAYHTGQLYQMVLIGSRINGVGLHSHQCLMKKKWYYFAKQVNIALTFVPVERQWCVTNTTPVMRPDDSTRNNWPDWLDSVLNRGNFVMLLMKPE